ncbi:leukocyte surface antigen CD53-like isoform X2 [Sitophilus oryzae]|uniref:Tetraspanin n=1 Tax=Sitophilus oryzae TaxID=7048 RepID=A0A6J2YT77_SITOR|nr:leukocyte surface antigen CD53-like isoform X2 [Sitophilus oryzae]
MGCTQGLTRIFVFLANFAFFLVGAALLILGILYTVNYTKLSDAIPDDFEAIRYVSIIAIIIGSIIVFIAFLGCCGALRSNTCMLTTYAAILFVIFLIQVALGVYALLKIKDDNQLHSGINSALNQLLQAYYQEDTAQQTFDFIQETFKCCGVKGPSDWNTTPTSCGSYTTGCSNIVFDWILSSVKVIGITAIAVSAVEVIGATLALCLSNCIRNHNRQTSYY